MATFRTPSRSLATSIEPDTDAKGNRIIYWHRELPPFDAEAMGEHVVEAASGRVPGTLAHRDELWSQCYEDLMAQVRIRLEQEVSTSRRQLCARAQSNPSTASTTTSPVRPGYTVASPTCSTARR